MQQARWGRKEITYIFTQMEADIPTNFGVVILERAQAWSGANRYQKELTAISKRQSTSPSFVAGHISQRLLMLCKSDTSPEVRSAQQQQQAL